MRILPSTPPIGGTGFEGATPRHQVAFSPSPLTTPLHSGATDGRLAVGATPLRAPMGNNLSINSATDMVTGGEIPREQRLRIDSTKRVLKAGFMNLPKLVPGDKEEETEWAPEI